ncbi:response regulator transcription factor [Salinimonas marina]|uniref:Response regulator transcription factor n=1 Tax=Salinimonas marina TaxID=2785918 RepID=A0A7S9DXY1_9ALTE|nr:response regulator transcription factor [Salinimonas marina]QPG05673.1 response regulator transcription factor [Salinimonas marina]
MLGEIQKKEMDTNILLIGECSIQNQFIQRELEKSKRFKILRKSLSQIRVATPVVPYTQIVVANTVLTDRDCFDFIVKQVPDIDLVVYDVPLDIAELVLFYCPSLKGVLHDNAPIEHLSRCIEAVQNGEYWLPRKVMAKMLLDYKPYVLSLQEVNHNSLTKREKQILDRLVKGLSNLEIAEELFVAESTVKTHIYKLYKKLNVCCRKEAIQKFSHLRAKKPIVTAARLNGSPGKLNNTQLN